MNAYSSSGRVLLHLQAWSHRPSHYAFHCRGIGREFNDTGVLALLTAVGWVTVWTLLLL